MGLRKDITEHVKTIPVKSRKKVEIISPTAAAVESEKDVSEPEITQSPVAVEPPLTIKEEPAKIPKKRVRAVKKPKTV